MSMTKACRRAMHKERGLAREANRLMSVYRAHGCVRQGWQPACWGLIRKAERYEEKRWKLLDRIHGKLGCR